MDGHLEQKPSTHRGAWAKYEDDELMKMKLAGAGYLSIGRALGRTKDSVRSRYVSLTTEKSGIVHREEKWPPVNDPWPTDVKFDSVKMKPSKAVYFVGHVAGYVPTGTTSALCAEGI